MVFKSRVAPVFILQMTNISGQSIVASLGLMISPIIVSYIYNCKI